MRYRQVFARLVVPHAAIGMFVATAAVGWSACRGTATAAPDTATRPADQDERMRWWREARFGMFVHWGLYAIPAGKWRDRTDHGEWIRDTARIPRAVYDEFRASWRPTAFDARSWARMAKAAGMQYLVVTSKHHDGFCLWDSAHTEWDVASTPDRRDILRELADACRAEGIAFCTYHSIMDWHHPDYLPRRPWETDRPTAGADFARFERHLHAQVGELIARYRPAVMWFDGEWENTWTHERGVRLFELCRREAPGMIVNNRVDVHRGGMGGFSGSSEAVGDFATPEQEIPATGLPGVDWESCMTMNSHWGWNAADTKWKPARELVHNLIDIASKGGNYLLNVGPRADGSFPPEAVERLAAIGAWMERNGEAIRGTTASVFDDLPWGRCTVKRRGATTTLYLHVFEPPADGRLVLPGLANRVASTRFVSGKGELTRIADVEEPTWALALTEPDPVATVVALEIDGAPDVVRAPRIAAESEQFVRSLAVTITQPSPSVVTTFTLDGSEPTPGSPRAHAPLRLDATCTVKATSWRGDRRAAGTVARTFTRVEPRPPVDARATRPGLVVERHTVDWRSIPDARSGLPVVARETVGTVGPLGAVGERVAFVYRGFLDVPGDDLYRFELNSDDGSKLWIDGQLAIDNDGLHGPEAKHGAVPLAAGLHAIEVVWFNATGNAALELRWAGPGQPFAPLTAAVTRH